MVLKNKFFISVLGVFTLFLSFPSATLAGSCGCDKTVISESISAPYFCFKNIATLGECQTKNNSNDGTFSFTNCSYYTGDNCTGGLQATDKTCKADEDCIQQGGGTTACKEGICYMDDAALIFYNNQVGSTPIDLKAPQLEIRIPGVVFDQTKNAVDANGYVHISYLASYISGVYKFALGAGSILAVIVIIMNGFRVTVSGGGEERNIGIQNIAKALTGLFILWTSYLLLFTINPDLTQFKPISVKYVSFEPIEREDESVSGTEATTSTLVEASGDNFSAARNLETGARVQVPGELQKALQVAATALKSQGILLAVASGYRSEAKQKELINQNCNNPPGNPKCDPRPGKPITCMLVGGSKGCPHTTGRAVDVWGRGNQCVVNGDQTKCNGKLGEKDPCRLDACQAAVIKAMKDAGFCSLSFEAWHFEMPKMSSSCN